MNNIEALPVVRIESPEREHPEIQALRENVKLLRGVLIEVAEAAENLGRDLNHEWVSEFARSAVEKADGNT